MRVPLIDLVRSRAIVHPSRITDVALGESGTLRLKLFGYSWWRDHDKTTEDSIEFVFTGVRDCTLHLKDLLDPERDEILELFEVESLAETDWAQPFTSEIYCNAPIPQPLKVYAVVHDFLRSRHALYEPGDFLNFGWGLLGSFTEITSSESYLLARGPEVICRLLTEELNNQAVNYNILPLKIRPPKEGLWIRLDNLNVVCEEAYAEWKT